MRKPEEAGQERRGRREGERDEKTGMHVCMVNNLWGVNLHKKRSLRGHGEAGRLSCGTHLSQGEGACLSKKETHRWFKSETLAED